MQTLSKGNKHLSTMIQSCKKEFDFALRIVTREKSSVFNMKKSMEQMRLIIIKRKQELHNLLVMNNSIVMKASCTSNDNMKVRSTFMNFLNHIKFLM
jgi:hypothetical protein